MNREQFKTIVLRAAMAAALAWAAGLQTWAQTPRAEYPRPQFERADWQNLNGSWTYSLDLGRIGTDKDEAWERRAAFDGRITVPFCVESKLSGVGYKDFVSRMWYQRRITVPSAWAGRLVMLRFGACDYETTVYIDGQKAGKHFGTGSSFEIDITGFVKPGKEANLVVRVDDNLRSGEQPGGKQSFRSKSHGCHYTRTTGIWQTVWMEAVDAEGLKCVAADPDVDGGQLVIRPSYYSENNDNRLTVKVLDGKKVVAQKTVACTNNNIVVLPIKNAKLWSPESPFLYDVLYSVADKDGKVIDEVKSYAGMRKVHLQGGYFYLNNKPYFQRLVLDQGFYPDGIWTAPSDEALKHDIEMSKAAGFNGARLHQKVFEERFHYWADKLGYLTWGESASWGLDVNNEVAVRNFLTEWADIVQRDRNHPSIVTWTPLNETWNSQPGVYVRFVNDLYNLTKSIDPTRPINDASGDGHVKTDLWTVHDYSRTKEKLIERQTIKTGVEPYRNEPKKDFLSKFNGQPYMLDEFGGLSWMKPEERKGAWGYGGHLTDIEQFYTLLKGQIEAIQACKYITGFCYTQLTDVEQETNGIYYYNRKPKFDLKRVKEIFEMIPSYIEKTEDLSDWKAK